MIEQEFTRQDLKRAAFDEVAFDMLIADFGLDEIREAYRSFANDVHAQLEGRSKEDPFNRKGATFLKSKLNARVRVLNSRIAERNRQETASTEAYGRKWSEFAYRLASELQALAPDVLDSLDGPDNAKISALEWWEFRKKKMEARGDD